MGLDRYRQKRDFSRTPEPAGEFAPALGGRLYVIQKHAARRLHYDFRLELDGALKSWAVPRGPSLDPGEKRLAVHVEDHPLEYGEFEGIIPPKQYGSGTVLLWDRGTWIPEGDPAAGYRKGRLKFRLEGEKLRGRWTLARMGGQNDEGKENWLLIKDRDEEARVGADAEITARLTESVSSGRQIEEIAADKDRVWHSNRDHPVQSRPRVLPGKKAPLPASLKPQLATLVDSPPAGAGWVYEIKFDGYRILARIDKGKVKMISRNGLDWTAKLQRQADALLRLPVQSAWLDGEVVMFNPDGTSNFQTLQNAFDSGSNASIVYCLFDLPYVDGHDLRDVPLVERKRLLREILAEAGPDSRLHFSDHLDAAGNVSYETACRQGLEGLIGKQADSRYVSGRSKAWIKLKCRKRQEFIICGYTDPSGSRQGFGSLVLGMHSEKGELVYAGRVGTGFSDASLRKLHAQLERLRTRDAPYARLPPAKDRRGVHWVKPELVAEVGFAEWTKEGVVRQASFEGLRRDKPPEAVGREAAQPPPESPAADPPNMRSAASGREGSPRALQIAGIRITNPDKILYPEAGITKLDVIRYYEAVGEWILPHLRKRPLSVVRCPDGREAECFFQKHASGTMPDAVDAIEVREKDGPAVYLAANSLPAVIALAQMGALEFHTWGTTAERLDRPDRITFDLDPDQELPWVHVVEGAMLTRTLLDELGLRSFLKTTGGKGLHIVVPIHRAYSWDEVKIFSQRVAQHLESSIPSRFTAKLAKSKRGKKIFIDYLRNGEGATAVSAFSTRARPGATVSTPISWDELGPDLRPEAFDIHTVPTRLSTLGSDPWDGYGALKQKLTASMKRALGLD